MEQTAPISSSQPSEIKKPLAKKRVWIETYGCQMNINDSEKMYRLLANVDFEATSQAEEADLILLNTCTIREKAEQKVFSSLGHLREHKIRRPEVIIGVAGCMAQMLGEKIRKRAPYVDLVFGTYAIQKLPEMVRELEAQRYNRLNFGFGVVETGKLIANDFDFLPLKDDDLLSPDKQQSDISKHVTIQNGCNKNCSYCIVPTVRGRELSRPKDDILAEIHELLRRGVKEIVLVGQTVNSYGKGTACDFADLLTTINALPGLERLRFVTSHPRDLNERLVDTMASCDKICEHLHLPVQSGSDRILRQMYRGYTAESYLKKVELLRRKIPNLSLTTDIIVAFPGETDEDFNATLDLMLAAQFESSFSFIYSPRPFTKAANWPEQIAPEVAKERINRLQALQDQITLERLHSLLGREVEVLVESKPSARPLRGLNGRTRSNWNVHFDGPISLSGQTVRVKIDRILSHSLQGVLL